MSNYDPFDFDDERELTAEDYAILEDDEERFRAGKSGCCVVILLPTSFVFIAYELYSMLTV